MGNTPTLEVPMEGTPEEVKTYAAECIRPGQKDHGKTGDLLSPDHPDTRPLVYFADKMKEKTMVGMSYSEFLKARMKKVSASGSQGALKAGSIRVEKG